MKRIIAIFLSLAILSGLCLTASAVSEGDYYDVQVRGDNYYLLDSLISPSAEVTNDGKITAADARQILRVAAMLNSDAA